MLKVYEITDREARTLVNEKKGPGVYIVNFDGKGANGRKLFFGVYFIRLKTADFPETKKIVPMR